MDAKGKFTCLLCVILAGFSALFAATGGLCWLKLRAQEECIDALRREMDAESSVSATRDSAYWELLRETREKVDRLLESNAVTAAPP